MMFGKKDPVAGGYFNLIGVLFVYFIIFAAMAPGNALRKLRNR
jgi:hypothetical protein